MRRWATSSRTWRGEVPRYSAASSTSRGRRCGADMRNHHPRRRETGPSRVPETNQGRTPTSLRPRIITPVYLEDGDTARQPAYPPHWFPEVRSNTNREPLQIEARCHRCRNVTLGWLSTIPTAEGTSVMITRLRKLGRKQALAEANQRLALHGLPPLATNDSVRRWHRQHQPAGTTCVWKCWKCRTETRVPTKRLVEAARAGQRQVCITPDGSIVPAPGLAAVSARGRRASHVP
jgi:hypothetical protein